MPPQMPPQKKPSGIYAGLTAALLKLRALLDLVISDFLRLIFAVFLLVVIVIIILVALSYQQWVPAVTGFFSSGETSTSTPALSASTSPSR